MVIICGGYGIVEAKMGTLLVDVGWTSQGRSCRKTKTLVNRIKEVLVDGNQVGGKLRA